MIEDIYFNKVVLKRDIYSHNFKKGDIIDIFIKDKGWKFRCNRSDCDDLHPILLPIEKNGVFKPHLPTANIDKLFELTSF